MWEWNFAEEYDKTILKVFNMPAWFQIYSNIQITYHWQGTLVNKRFFCNVFPKALQDCDKMNCKQTYLKIMWTEILNKSAKGNAGRLLYKLKWFTILIISEKEIEFQWSIHVLFYIIFNSACNLHTFN